MKLFLHGHATHPEWRTALGPGRGADRGAAARRCSHVAQPTLGWVYLSDRFADCRRGRAGRTRPALAGRRLGRRGRRRRRCQRRRIFRRAGAGADARRHRGGRISASSRAHGRWPDGRRPASTASTALVHADPATADLAELIAEMAERTATGYLFGGLASSRSRSLHIADGVFEGGLSGVAFSREVALLSRVTQGCQPVGPVRRITAAERNLVVDARRRAGTRLPAARPAARQRASRAPRCRGCARRWSA